MMRNAKDLITALESRARFFIGFPPVPLLFPLKFMPVPFTNTDHI